MLSVRTVAIQRCGWLSNKFSVKRDLLPNGIRFPFSLEGGLKTLLNDSRTFSSIITTPSGTALGGNVSLTLSANGDYTFSGSMHDSGADPYDFRVRAVFTSSDSTLVLGVQHSGHVDGSPLMAGSNPNRTDSWNEKNEDLNFGGGTGAPSDPVPEFENRVKQGIQKNILKNWLSISNGMGNFDVKHEYGDVGFLGHILDILKDIAEWLAIYYTAGATATAIVIGSELCKSLNIKLGVQLPAGIFIAAGIVYIFGPGVLLAAAITGAVIAANIKTRSLTDDEKQHLNEVFAGTVPLDSIVITNIQGPNHRPFTIPSIDGSILVNMGDHFDNAEQPLGYYERFYQLLVHEHTHAWRITNLSMPWVACKTVDARIGIEVGSNVYDNYAPPGPPFGDYGIEEQAAMVDQWYGATRQALAGHPPSIKYPVSPDTTLTPEGTLQMDPNDPYFPYITNHIWLGEG